MPLFVHKQKRFITAIVAVVLALSAAGALTWFFVNKRQHLSSNRPPNVIIISLDGLRPDHLGCYGYERNTSPMIDKLAAEAIVFENHFSQSSHRNVAYLSLLTSLYPSSYGTKIFKTQKENATGQVPTLIDVFKSAGYANSGFAQHSVLTGYGFDKKFDSFFTAKRPIFVLSEAVNWIAEKKNKNFFAFISLNELLPPYRYRPQARSASYLYRQRDYLREQLRGIRVVSDNVENTVQSLAHLSDSQRYQFILYSMLKRYPGRNYIFRHHLQQYLNEWTQSRDHQLQYDSIIDVYDVSIARLDYHLGVLCRFLKTMGLWDNTLIVITASSAQELMEHDRFGSVPYLYDSLIHIPLIVKMPGQTPAVYVSVEELTEAIDVMPTVLDVAGLDYPDNVQGESLLSLLQGKHYNAKKLIFSATGKEWAARTNRYKFIKHRRHKQKYSLYDIKVDMSEKVNIREGHPYEIEQLRGALDEHTDKCRTLYHVLLGENR